MGQRYDPDDPREWINRARSDVALAKAVTEQVYLEDLCFHAQQAAEKAVKAILIKLGIEFPYVHDLAALLTLVEAAGRSIPDSVREAERLTRFAVATRYPALPPPVTHAEWQQAVAIAEEVVRWAAAQIMGT